MNIIDVTVKKMDHSDPRYPDPDPRRPFVDVYLCECETDEGPKEAPFFIRDGQPLTPELAGIMLQVFAAAVRRMEIKKAA